jgi:hypothetical protein
MYSLTYKMKMILFLILILISCRTTKTTTAKMSAVSAKPVWSNSQLTDSLIYLLTQRVYPDSTQFLIVNGMMTIKDGAVLRNVHVVGELHVELPRPEGDTTIKKDSAIINIPDTTI